MAQRIYDILSDSQATLINTRPLPRQATLATWKNTFDRVRYEAPRQHTVSLYLDGGAQARRVGHSGSGWPGTLCLFPEGSYSDWEISGPFRFMHFHFGADHFAQFASETLDIDPRSLALPDESFVDLPDLRAGMTTLLRAQGPLEAETTMSEIFAALARHSGRTVPVRGGLSPRVARRVTDYMRAHLDQTLRLAELAQLAGLSEFHFQRMFRAQFGCSPQRWQETRRIEEARRLIAAGEDLAGVAAACGFAHQSHLTRVFRRMTGMTPGAWRKTVSGVAPSARA